MKRDDGADRPLREMWLSAVSDVSGDTFASAVNRDFVLEGSIFMLPITGRDKGFAALRVSSGIYDSIRFTHELLDDSRIYLKWEGVALNEKLAGITVLGLDVTGRIDIAAIHCRPFGAVVALSKEMGRRLTGVVDAKTFYGDIAE